MRVYRKVVFSAAHRLRKHRGKCSRLHGHNFVVEVAIDGSVSRDTGMIVDFSEIDAEIKDMFDHKTILHKDDPLVEIIPSEHLVIVDFEPTCENIAAIIAKILSKYGLVSVKVWENDKCFAEVS